MRVGFMELPFLWPRNRSGVYHGFAPEYTESSLAKAVGSQTELRHKRRKGNSGMTYLIIGIILFGGIHLFSMVLPKSRDAVEKKLGEGRWKGLFSLVSLLGLGLIILGVMVARSGPLAADWIYFPADWARPVTMLAVFAGFISIAASHGKGYLKLWLRNPMSIGIGLWAFGHLLSNGKRTDVILFGTFLAIALLDVILSTLRGEVPAYQPRLRSDAIAVIVGIGLYLIFLFGFHPYVLNMPVAR
jgi:uncharacterized membrane protein